MTWRSGRVGDGIGRGEADAVAALALGAVERLVGAREQSGKRFGGLAGRNAVAGRDPQLERLGDGQGAARQSPKTTISDEKLGGQAAKRLEFTTDEGYTNVLWLTRKGKNGAMVSLVYTSECEDDIPAIRKSIVSSFHWNR